MNIVNIKDRMELASKVIESFYGANRKVNRAFFEKESSLTFVALEGDTIVGMVYGYVLDRPDTIKKQLFLYSIDVIDEYRRQGIGSKLLQAFLDSVDPKDVKNTFLIVDQTNEGALEFYKSLGGKTKHMEDDYSIVMIWEDKND